MLLYKDGRFHAAGISFQLPDGFFLETCPEESYSNGFMLYPPEGDFWLQIIVSSDCMDAKKEFEFFFSDIVDLKPQTDITPISLTGLSGYQAIYTGSGHTYYEIRLNVPYGDSLYNFVLVLTAKDTGGEVPVEHPCVKEVLDSIQRSDYHLWEPDVFI